MVTGKSYPASDRNGTSSELWDESNGWQVTKFSSFSNFSNFFTFMFFRQLSHFGRQKGTFLYFLRLIERPRPAGQLGVPSQDDLLPESCTRSQIAVGTEYTPKSDCTVKIGKNR